ncbi:unnamed protein product, partial [Prorocentrum cordatum]
GSDRQRATAIRAGRRHELGGDTVCGLQLRVLAFPGQPASGRHRPVLRHCGQRAPARLRHPWARRQCGARVRVDHEGRCLRHRVE